MGQECRCRNQLEQPEESLSHQRAGMPINLIALKISVPLSHSSNQGWLDAAA